MWEGARLKNTEVGIGDASNLHFSEILVASDFINKNIDPAKWEAKKKVWIDYFTRACGTEKAFFDLGIPTTKNIVPAYKVVTDGTYKIRNYGNNHFLFSQTDSSVITKVLQANEGKVRDRPCFFSRSWLY
jgi:hypothetical protein